MVRKHGKMVRIHTKKFRECVKEVKGSKYNKGKYNPYAVCMSSLGYKKSVTPAHRRKFKMLMKTI